MSAAMKLTIAFKSDWHIGSGAGIPGSVDRQVLRDSKFMPYIPGKTLNGILRDSAEFISQHLAGDWQSVVDNLFGTQPQAHGGKEGVSSRPGKLKIRSGVLSKGLAAALSQKGNEGLRDALFFVKPGVTIDPETGRSEEKKLFFTEQVRAGLTLHSKIEVAGGNLSEHEEALLQAAVMAVRHLGGKRRRGGGNCTLKLDSDSCDWKKLLSCQEPKTDTYTGSRNSVGADKDAPEILEEKTCWKRYALTVTAVDPLLIAKIKKGNVFESQRCIPGTQLLPQVLKVLAGGRDLFTAVAKGKVIVTNLLPKVKGCETTYPVPNCFSGLKENPKQRLNERVEGDAKDGKQYKPIRTGWVGCRDDKGKSRWMFYSGDDLLTQRMHNSVLDSVQRPHENVGGIYTYQAIRPGTKLIGEVLIDTGMVNIPGDFEDRIRKGIRTVGRSSKDDYGRVEVAIEKITDKPTACGEISGNKLVLWLQSDVLVRNENNLPSADPRHLAGVLKKSLDLKGDISLSRAFGRVERCESWSRPWGLPRPSLVGLKAGSVYEFDLEDNQEITPQRLMDLQMSGIGERRAEGFGRVLFNHDMVMSKYCDNQWSLFDRLRDEDEDEVDDDCKLSEDDQAIFHLLERIHYKEIIRRKARRIAFEYKDWLGIEKTFWWKNGTPNPGTSQWGALRTAAGRLEEHPVSLEQWLDGVEERDNRKDKWTDGGKLSALRTLIEDKSKCWTLLGNISMPEKLQKDLHLYAVRILLENMAEAVFDKASQQQKQAPQQEMEAGQ